MIAYNATKIIATLGPASEDVAVLEALVRAGLDVARLNFSHGTPNEHAERCRRLRQVAEAHRAYVAILADLQGPKIRTGALKEGKPITLQAGQTLTITTKPIAGTAERLSTTYENLPQDVYPGARLLLDDGRIELRVQAIEGDEIRCQVVTGGVLGEHKGLNLPGVRLSVSALTEKDEADLEFALLQLAVDYIALSFVREAADIELARALCAKHQKTVPIIAKLERPEALERMPEIVAAADGVMIARGDLAVELSPEEVPIWQKRICKECARQRKPVITATQMLESMCEAPRPTRAEASDVANAIFDGTDVVMLSEETAIGRYPVEAVAMMRRIATATEQELRRWSWEHSLAPGNEQWTVPEAIGAAASEIAARIGARAIIAFTQTGATARLVSKCRPSVPILACTPLTATARRCSLYWGVQPVVVPPAKDTDKMIRQTKEALKEQGFVQVGDRVVITAGAPIGQPGTTNLLTVEEIV